MFDFGFAELIFIVAIAVLVIGPDEIPAVMRGLGRIIKRFQYMRYALTEQFDDFVMQADINEMQSHAKKQTAGDTDLEKELDQDIVSNEDLENPDQSANQGQSTSQTTDQISEKATEGK